jgi:hypothetical protein
MVASGIEGGTLQGWVRQEDQELKGPLDLQKTGGSAGN